jgi:hypothetical protein
MDYLVIARDGVLSMAHGTHWARGEVIPGYVLPEGTIKLLLEEGCVEPVDGSAPPTSTVESELTAVKGVSRAMAERLVELGVMSIQDLSVAPDEVLCKVFGIGETTAAALRRSAKASLARSRK